MFQLTENSLKVNKRIMTQQISHEGRVGGSDCSHSSNDIILDKDFCLKRRMILF